MFGYIDGYDFYNMEAEKYWSPTKSTNLKELVKSAVFSGEYIGSRKIDGHWGMIIKDEDGTVSLRGRTESVNGGYTDKIEWVSHIKEYFNTIPNGTVVLGELYLPSNEKSRAVTTILGCLKDKAIQRQEKGEKLNFYIFDCLAYGGNNLMEKPLEERLNAFIPLGKDKKNTYIHYAKFYQNEDLYMYISHCLEKGFEGVVLQDRTGTYEPGKRPARKSIKVKQEIGTEIDAFLTGNFKPATQLYNGTELENWQYWRNIKTNERVNKCMFNEYYAGEPWEAITKMAFMYGAGSVEVGVYDNKEDKIIPIAWISNISDEVKIGIVNENEKWKYKVVKLSAMLREKDTGKFRHSKIMEWREDKNWKDCGVEQLDE